ncbi:glycosyltransferase family 4 protein [Aequorivita sp. Q41]|uniref:glycosyltransferase family 4 protein n=1 Tax=Aequorivita sp. Q41 TaxID=3153300 RepID=UPI003241C8C2
MKKILYIGNKLSKKGSTITSIETLGSFLEREGFFILSFSSFKNKILRILDMLRATFVFRNKVSWVLIDTYSTQNFYYAVAVAALCRIIKVPYIPILRGGNLPQRLDKSKKLSKNLFNGATTNVAPSQYILEEFKRRGYSKLTYIPNTIEIANYPFKIRNQVTPKLLWVRSFSEIYNPLLALEIVEILKKKGMPVSLCMVGPDKDGSLKRCEKIALDLNLPVSFKGMLKKEEWIELSTEYDIFINTTNFDNMPVSVMEAMALGLPVISTNVGGMPYLIDNDENGILLPPNNAKVFVEAIEALCNNSLKTAGISYKSRLKIEQFNWREIMAKWTRLLNT